VLSALQDAACPWACASMGCSGLLECHQPMCRQYSKLYHQLQGLLVAIAKDAMMMQRRITCCVLYAWCMMDVVHVSYACCNVRFACVWSSLVAPVCWENGLFLLLFLHATDFCSAGNLTPVGYIRYCSRFKDSQHSILCKMVRSFFYLQPLSVDVAACMRQRCQVRQSQQCSSGNLYLSLDCSLLFKQGH